MLENILLACTNLGAVAPIMTAWKMGDKWTALVIGYVGTASFISHLMENHKHGMSGIGIGFNKKMSYLLNRLDVIGCILTGARLAYIYWLKHGTSLQPLLSHPYLLALGILSYSLNIVSEYDKYNPRLKWLYIPTHSLWHISVFWIMNRFLQKLYYNCLLEKYVNYIIYANQY